ncbi:MAG: glycosyltransferase family 1 protein [bacterium]
MRVGVDVSVLAWPHTGIARYLGNMLTQMLPRSSGLEFFLYSARPVGVGFDGRWRLRAHEGVGGTVASYWIQQICPRWMSEDGIDVFWGQNYMLPLRLRRPCRRVLTLHDLTGLLMPWTMPARRRLNFRLFQQRAASASDCLVAVSQATARLARVCLGVPPSKLRVVLEGCDASFAVPPGGRVKPRATENAREAVRRRFALEPGFLLAVGTIEPRKGHATLFGALRSLPDAPVLAVAGGLGWRYREILGEMKELEATGRVRYLGRVDDEELVDLCRAAGLLVYPSLYEGFGLPVLEAMACGCPVVCSRSSSLPEVGGDAVRYFTPGDGADLARILQEVLGRPAELEEMRTAGLRRAQSFSFGRAADEMMTILRELSARDSKD